MKETPEALIEQATTSIAKAGGLVSPADLAREWGVTHQAVQKRIAAGRFPAPIFETGRTRIYLRAQVQHLRHS